MVFDAYARYYDLLYCDKDYAAEAEYVATHIRKQIPGAKKILELGCGTGTHAAHLVRMGFTVHGVDLSAEMLKHAEEHLQYLPEEKAKRLSFSCGDIRQFRHRGHFDAVISLFHVMSYQIKNSDIAAVFKTAQQHLKPKGVFIFDCWYGPAVLTQKPEVRVKRLADEKIEMIRIAEPEMYPNENRVDVHYQVLIKEKSTGKVEILEETHRMRYLFMPEILGLCEEFGFSMLDAREWMTGKSPGLDTWGVYFVVGA
jgi:SAM-dependent methyltransferase